jgi:prepilin-type N-terminal cleavage/methylation domain-containing protein
MTISKNRGGFTLVELLVVIAIIGTLVGLLLPAVQSAREAARRSACSNNSKQLGLSILNFESARRRLPAANVNGAATYVASTAGFSWITQILPFIEETNLYTQMSSNSSRFATYGTTFATTSLPQLVCPSFAGDKSAATGTLAGAAVTNYKAAASVGFTTGVPSAAAGLAGVITAETYGTEATAPKTGITLAQITDGTSKTFAIAETREVGNAGWINGTHSWVTASNTTATGAANTAGPTGVVVAVRDNQATTGSFGGYGGAGTYGASSNHQAGITMHTYADGHVGAVTPEIQDTLYGSLFSRAGSEPTSEQP